MAKITFSISPSPDGHGWANISAEGEPNEVEAMSQAVDKLMQKYPVLKPKTEDMSAKAKINLGITRTR